MYKGFWGVLPGVVIWSGINVSGLPVCPIIRISIWSWGWRQGVESVDLYRSRGPVGGVNGLANRRKERWVSNRIWPRLLNDGQKLRINWLFLLKRYKKKKVGYKAGFLLWLSSRWYVNLADVICLPPARTLNSFKKFFSETAVFCLVT
jgi:hypothetical protein